MLDLDFDLDPSITDDVLDFADSANYCLDFSTLPLKSDHSNRPLWVCPNGLIFLEAFSSVYQPASDFLIAIAEPVARPTFIHEYRITRYSLYAGSSMGLRCEDILSGLERLAKNQSIDKELVKMIEDTTARANKIKLVLRKQRYFVEATRADVLMEILSYPEIERARVKSHMQDESQRVVGWDIDLQTSLLVSVPEAKQIVGPDGKALALNNSEWSVAAHISQLLAMGILQDEAEQLAKEEAVRRSTLRVFRFEVLPSKVEFVRQMCSQLHYPMLEEYDFREDSAISKESNLLIQLKASTTIRDYQEKSLAKMFGNGRARSGIIVLPCGAGKTCTAITAACTIKKNTIVFCTTEVAANQWRRQFKYFCHVDDAELILFTSSNKLDIEHHNPCVLITTYSMIAYGGLRGKKTNKIMEDIKSREWGLVLLDEVHVAPAETFRRCVTITHSRCKLGLTATLVREDGLIEDLFYLIGPKLYEANWNELQKAGYLAKVQCLEVRCEMAKDFYDSYLRESDHKKKKLLCVMNPIKFLTCEYLMRQHMERGDKILVFCDDVFPLIEYSTLLKKPVIYGLTTNRDELLNQFRTNDDANVLFISQVGDNSIDLPDANVIIQISSHFASRRQEAQRLGRILRPKPRVGNEFNAFFYSLVSSDTKEIFYATKRQRFLVDQGYAFKVLTNAIATNWIQTSNPPPVMKDFKVQQTALGKVMAYDAAIEREVAANEKRAQLLAKNLTKKRKNVSSAALSGADGTLYAEVSKKTKITGLAGVKARKQKLAASAATILKNLHMEESKEPAK